MFNQWGQYVNEGKRFIQQYFLNRPLANPSQGLCAISLSPQAFKLVCVKTINHKLVLTVCETHAFQNEQEFVAKLSDVVKVHRLTNTACTLILAPDDYQLLLTDALPVAANEFQAAIRWKIKDLLRFPLDDVLIDHYPLPKMKVAQNKIMVVAAQRKRLEHLTNLINQSKLMVGIIDVTELALRNMMHLYEKKDETLGIVYVFGQQTMLLFTAQKAVYVSRILKMATSETQEGIYQMDRLAAEIQRSFDFYQNLWDKPLPARFLFAATRPIAEDDIQKLAQRINVPIEKLNVIQPIESKLKLSYEDQGHYLPLIGGALRESDSHVATN